MGGLYCIVYSKGSGNHWKVLSRNLGSGPDLQKEQLSGGCCVGKGGKRDSEGRQEEVAGVRVRESGAWVVVLAVDSQRLRSSTALGCKWTEGADGL